MQRIQSILDSHKTSMSDQAYLELCNSLMAEHKKDDKEEVFYEVWYVYPEVSMDDEHSGTFRIGQARAKEFVKLDKETAGAIKDTVDRVGSCGIETDLLVMNNRHLDILQGLFKDTDTDVYMSCSITKISPA